MRQVPRTQTLLDSIYQRILAPLQQTFSLQTALPQELFTALRQLCSKAQQQDALFPLSCLPLWSYLAAGGYNPMQAVPLAAAWRCLHLAGKLLNDAAKQSPNPYLPSASSAELVNVGTSLTFLGQAILTETADREIPSALVLQFQSDFAYTVLDAAAGQHVQLGKKDEWSMAEYEAVVVRRSGKPFALALQIGARLWLNVQGSENALSGQALADYGYHLGMIIQLSDDFNGVWQPAGRSDLAAKRWTWPLLYAQTLADEACWARLRRLLENAPEDTEAEAEARALMVQLEVPLAMMMASEKHRQAAEQSLASLGASAGRNRLVEMVRRASLAPFSIES